MNNVSSENRQVAVGAVAQQLSKRRPRRANWLPKLALAVCTIACGFIVHAAIENREIWLDQKLLHESHDLPAPVVNSLTSAQPNRKRDSQVRSVIELVGAFEHLKDEEAEQRNPLALPDETPTAPVAFYAPPPPESESQTSEFLEQIQTSRAKEEGKQLAATDLIASTTQHPSDRPTTSVPPAPTTTLRETDMPSLERLSPAETPLEITIAPASAVSAAEVPTVAPTLAALPEAIEDAPPAVAATTAAGTTAVDSPASVVPVTQSLDQAEQGRTAAMDTESEPQISEELLLTVAAYDKALLALKNKPESRKLSRLYYTALAELAATSWTDNSELGRERLSQIYGDPQLVKLTSAAASSWARWSQRTTPGILVAGQIESSESFQDGYLVRVKTQARKSKVMTIYTEDSVDSFASSTQSALFYGVITHPTDSAEPLIQTRLLNYGE